MTRSVIEWSAALRSVWEESGDQYLVKPIPDGVLVAVVDGIGHGREAASAARAAIGVVDAHADEPVVPLLARCHAKLRPTRGAVLSLAAFSAREATMTWVGVGNVDGILLRAGLRARPERLVLPGGVVGHRLPALDPVTVPVAQGDTLIFTTDGIRGEFAEGFEWGYLPPPTAERILADHAKTTDDALVVVARYVGGAG
ncbi:MAG: stage II sporulation protein E (SpoIIE) [Candidatus Rokuibacteriota bacterium]|nr:MAG: stage II sporulation protein E (SpoIIE) [Candidatus Rokubacteria bacterium]